MLPDAFQIADLFHPVRLTNARVDGRVQRRWSVDAAWTTPWFGFGAWVAKAGGRLTDTGKAKAFGLLAAGDQHGEVKTAWHAKEVVRQISTHSDPDLTTVVGC